MKSGKGAKTSPQGRRVASTGIDRPYALERTIETVVDPEYPQEKIKHEEFRFQFGGTGPARPATAEDVAALKACTRIFLCPIDLNTGAPICWKLSARRNTRPARSCFQRPPAHGAKHKMLLCLVVLGTVPAIGPPEIRQVDARARYFNPTRDGQRVDSSIRNLEAILTIAGWGRARRVIVAGAAT